jgi:hypothetical protein
MRRREFISVVVGAAVWPLGPRGAAGGASITAIVNQGPAVGAAVVAEEVLVEREETPATAS